jgi:Predicted secreted Zn-dependent protease
MKIPTLCCTISLLIFSGILVPDLAAEVKPSINYKYFTVSYTQGKSAAEMVMLQTPLISNNGHRNLGLTRWGIKVSEATFTHPKIDVCRIADPGISCHCEITLPKFEGGDALIRREFDKIAEETKEHELEHCRIAVKHANELAQAFKNMKDQPCDNVGKTMREIYDKVMDDCSVEQKRFDNAEYGYSQYLHLESLQRLHDAGFNIAPPSDGRNLPMLDRQKKPDMKVVPQGVEELKKEGFYKDENGVWRNY